MKTCSKCQCEFEDRFKFCPECGSSTGVSSESLAGFSMGAQRTMENVSEKAQAVQDDRSMGDHQTMINKPAAEKGSFQGTTESVDDRYESLEEIGRGGFARVWRARDRKLDRIVALKRLIPESLSGSEGARTLERFRREANAIASLNHRNIVGVYDRGEDAKGPYIVMEYVGGGSLKDLLRRQKKLEVVAAVKLAIGIARGLDHAHRKNLVHRDIKPANILLHEEASESVPKISDFGLVRMGVDTGVSMSGYGMGTLTYMPPEQRRDAKNVNHTADIYALGKTLYEMVTGEVPDDVDVDKLPPGLVEVVKRCVKPNPEERYFSVAELLSALEGVGSGMNEKRVQHPVGVGTDSNACPSCGASNVPGLKFCGKCGGGLTRSCPECSADVSVHSQFCGGCGTDVPAFGRFANGITQMETFLKIKQYDRVIKEHALLPAEARMQGKKGMELKKRAVTIKEETDRALAKRAQLGKELAKELDSGRFIEALNAATALQDIDPHDRSIGDTVLELRRKIDDNDWEEARAEAVRECRETQFDKASEALRLYVQAHSDGAHVREATEKLEKIKAWDGMHAQLQKGMRSGDFEGAKEFVRKLASSGLDQEVIATLEQEISADHNAYLVTLKKAEAATKEKRLDEAEQLWRELRDLVPDAESVKTQGLQAQAAREKYETLCHAAKKEYEGGYHQQSVKSSKDALEIFPKGVQAQDVLKKAQSGIRNTCIAVLAILLVLGLMIGAAVYMEYKSKVSNPRQPTSVEGNVANQVTASIPGGPTIGAPWTSQATGMEFVWVAALKIWVGKYEVTNDEYRKKVPSHDSGHSFNGDRQPVVYVNFDDAKAFAQWMTERDKAYLGSMRYQVISEADWLACAQCGGWRTYPWGYTMPPKYGNYSKISGYDDGYVVTCPVEKSGRNEWGLYGVGGNVAECCALDASGSLFGAMRGAAWDGGLPWDVRCVTRGTVDLRSATGGFRLVLSR